MKPNYFIISKQETAELKKLSAKLPEIELENGGKLKENIRNTYLDLLAGFNFAAKLKKQVKDDLYKISGRGYIVIDGIFSEEKDIVEDRLKLSTAISCLVGEPFRVIDRLGLWEDIPVSIEIEPFKFRGTGYNPLHIDIVNSTKPPDIVVFFCEKVDPLGGGQSIVSNLQNVVTQLSQDEIEYLQQPIFREGLFYGLSGVGTELNPFPILEKTLEGYWRVRFTGKMLFTMEEGGKKDLVRKFEEILFQTQEKFQLKSGQLLVVNQIITAHGREELGQNQESISPKERRFLYQTFMNFNQPFVTS